MNWKKKVKQKELELKTLENSQSVYIAKNEKECSKENTKQIEVLTKQRDELLPLLMNGQVSVNYHLAHD